MNLGIIGTRKYVNLPKPARLARSIGVLGKHVLLGRCECVEAGVVHQPQWVGRWLRHRYRTRKRCKGLAFNTQPGNGRPLAMVEGPHPECGIQNNACDLGSTPKRPTQRSKV